MGRCGATWGPGLAARDDPGPETRSGVTDLLPLCPVMRVLTQKQGLRRAPTEEGRTVAVQSLGPGALRDRKPGWLLPASAFREAMWS